jgi:2,3,4,5-tetrahydropyridine-2-carboxylate N-succinyltransferase
MPDAAFYLWLDTLGDDTEFTRRLYEEQSVSVLPGSYLAREARGVNPGKQFVRIALVASTAECSEAAHRIAAFWRSSKTREKAMNELQETIEQAWERRAELSPGSAPAKIGAAVDEVLGGLDAGKLRVAEKIDGEWRVHQWIKKAVLLSFPPHGQRRACGAATQYYDKVPSKFARYSREDFERGGFRVVPPAMVRRGAFIGRNAVVMPSYVNVGAYVDEGTMVDTWATVGSCAQIGKNVHLSGGVGIGGVLEPLQANPTIIEDNCFVGARSEIVEGVVVEAGSVISMGVFIGQSTRVFDRASGEVSYGRIPAGSVVVSGTLPSSDGKCQLYCAVIVKRVDAGTRAKTSINELLRGD